MSPEVLVCFWHHPFNSKAPSFGLLEYMFSLYLWQALTGEQSWLPLGPYYEEGIKLLPMQILISILIRQVLLVYLFYEKENWDWSKSSLSHIATYLIWTQISLTPETVFNHYYTNFDFQRFWYFISGLQIIPSKCSSNALIGQRFVFFYSWVLREYK
jgi:hypothetical protein